MFRKISHSLWHLGNTQNQWQLLLIPHCPVTDELSMVCTCLPEMRLYLLHLSVLLFSLGLGPAPPSLSPAHLRFYLPEVFFTNLPILCPKQFLLILAFLRMYLSLGLGSLDHLFISSRMLSSISVVRSVPWDSYLVGSPVAEHTEPLFSTESKRHPHGRHSTLQAPEDLEQALNHNRWP